MADRAPPMSAADLARVDVDDAADGEATVAEPAVAGERLAEVCRRPTMTTSQSWVRPELALDLEHQELDVVADAAGAVAAEVREVLADLGGVHATELGEFARRRCW